MSATKPIDVESLRARIVARDFTVAIIGLGYVGLPMVCAAARQGFRVLGFDIDKPKVAGLNAGKSPLMHIPDALIQAARRSKLFEATGDFTRIGDADGILICVPTPLTRHRDPDLSYVETTLRNIAPHMRRGQLLILESTTYPGTTTEVIVPILEAAGFVPGHDIFLAYSPEREDPGNQEFDASGIPKVVGGAGEAALGLACELYDQLVCRTVPVSSTATAEAVKLTENIFRAVNIALVNELKVVFDAMGIDVWEVIEAAKTKPFGFMPFYPGPGLGGHCIPIDPFYLTWKAREYGISTRFIELAGEVNTSMPRHVVQRLADALDQRAKKGLNGAAVLVLGVAYKKNIGDIRESPALMVMELLRRRGAKLAYYDPHVAEILSTRDHTELAGMRSIKLDRETVADFDAAVIITDHDAVDYQLLVDNCPLVVDTRNVTRDLVTSAPVVKS